MSMHPSPKAAAALLESGVSPFSTKADELMGQTDCPGGCVVEADGHCPHGFLSAGRTASVI